MILFFADNSSSSRTDIKVIRSKTECYITLAALRSMSAVIDDDVVASANLEPEVCCKDMGIGCEGTTVLAIEWANKGLNRTLPESISELPKLTKLDLSYNEISGAFPEFLATGPVVYL